MIKKFQNLRVRVLTASYYYDGPIAGVCEYEGELLYYRSVEEIMFPFPETDPSVIAVQEDGDHRDWHRLRIFGIYRIPKEHIITMMHNDEVIKTFKGSLTKEEWDQKLIPLPKEFSEYKEFEKVAWQWAIGYTTEDDWDAKQYYARRRGRDKGA